ncbi:DNA-directed RNA polymerase subunit omega [Nibricoccus sp. IMCC34717]|uniref:DNA-directed RNA polymerase subunit omega n=1 Tax=Nibricoccus sp. IMCC34717 TaxID=3034021 RepID=UPI00384C49EF
MILINLVSLRVKQLRRGSRPLVVSLEKLSNEDIALREVAEGKISYELAKREDLEAENTPTAKQAVRNTVFGHA